MANDTETADHLRSTPYMPSNASEGIDFAENFCFRCIYYGDPENGNGCFIETNALAGIQPEQWIEDEHGPRCVSFYPRAGE